MPTSKLLSVREFAGLTHMPESTVRYYSQIGLLSPALRGENNYRYYSMKQVADVNVIRILHELGVSLSEIQAVMPRRTPAVIINLLQKQAEQLSRNMVRWAGAKDLLHTLYDMIQSVLHIEENSIEIALIPEKKIIRGKKNEYCEQQDAYDALSSFYKSINKEYPNVCFHYPVWGIYFEDKIKQREYVFPEAYYIYSSLGNSTIPEHLCAVGYMRCGYGNGKALYEKMFDYIDKHGFEICGNAYEEYPLNELCSPDDTQYLMRLMIHVREKKIDNIR